MPPPPLTLGVLILLHTLSEDQRNLTPGYSSILTCIPCGVADPFCSHFDSHYEAQEHVYMFHSTTNVKIYETERPIPRHRWDIRNSFSRKARHYTILAIGAVRSRQV